MSGSVAKASVSHDIDIERIDGYRRANYPFTLFWISLPDSKESPTTARIDD